MLKLEYWMLNVERWMLNVETWTFRMLQHASSEVIIIQLQVNLNSKLVDIKRQEIC